MGVNRGGYSDVGCILTASPPDHPGLDFFDQPNIMDTGDYEYIYTYTQWWKMYSEHFRE